MKVLRATPRSANPRADDFNFCFDGEPLTLSTLICSTAEARKACGCGRAFSGIASELATTFGVVIELSESEAAEFESYFRESPHVSSWTTSDLGPTRTSDILWFELEEIARLLADQPEGSEVRSEVLQTEFTLLLADGGRVRGTRSPEVELLVNAGANAVEGIGRDD